MVRINIPKGVSMTLGLVFYKKGEQSETFYIIKEGKVCVETNVELEKNNKWPTVVFQAHQYILKLLVIYREANSGKLRRQ